MESSPRPGYYPDPSVPGYIRYWDGTQWVAGTSKPMPEGDDGLQVESAPPPPPRTMADAESAQGRSAIAFPQQPVAADGAASGAGFASAESPGTGFPGTGSTPPFQDPQAEEEPPPPSSAWPSYQNANPFAGQEGVVGGGFPGTGSTPPLQAAAPALPEQGRQSTPPGFTPPVPQPAAGFTPPVPQPPASFDPVVPPSPTGYATQPPTAQQPGVPGSPAAAAPGGSYRIRLRTPDGKPFDGPEITTGPAATPWEEAGAPGSGLTEVPAPPSMSAPWGGTDKAATPRKTAPKVVVKSSSGAKFGHVLAVLLISAIGVGPLAYLMLGAIHKHEDDLAATITVPTKMNVIDGTSGAYLAGMVVVLLVVTLGYRRFLKRRG